MRAPLPRYVFLYNFILFYSHSQYACELPPQREFSGSEAYAVEATHKWKWVNPVEEQACKNSRTVPIGQLTGSSRRSMHHEVRGLHFGAYSFLVLQRAEIS